jgi:hypothetical protein
MDRILNVSARNFSDPDAREAGWKELQKANLFAAAFQSTAKEADAALDVLNKYADLLVTLSSDEFTDSLDATSKSLGKSLDKAVKQYNESFRKPQQKSELGLIGGSVAAVIRGGGGIWIRHRQAKYLKEYVTAAQPVVMDLTAEVQVLMTNKVMTELSELEDRFKEDFKTAAGRLQHLSLETLQTMADTQRKISSARDLCKSAASAAGKFAAAHSKLAENVSRRQNLKSRIEEIMALADEIKKAQKLQKDLSK